MITKALDMLIGNKLYRESRSIEIAKGFYNKGGLLKRIKRRIRLWL